MSAGAGRPAWVRPALHAFTGVGALLLGVLPREGALACAVLGLLAGWVVFPLTPMDRLLRRPGEPYLGGLRTYPLAVFGLVLLLPPAEAAAAWAVLAFGDPAATLVGRRIRAPALLGHPKATWSGTPALFLTGTLAAWGMGHAVEGLAALTGAVESGAAPGLVRAAAAAGAATLVDLLPVPPDDNLPCAASAGITLRALRTLVQ